jgi:hypothetical protein
VRFAKWLRRVLDELLLSRHVRALERQIQSERAEYEQNVSNFHLQIAQQLRERLKDKDATIQDLRVRLAVAETDSMREKLAKAAQKKPFPVPEFSGPVSFQDELSAMNLEVEPEATQEKKPDEV